MNKEYSKLQGGAGHHGGLYQIKLLLTVLLKAYQRNKEFRLSTENKAGEKFDDIILQEENEAILVQVKHKTSSKKRITFSELFSENSDFSLPKYLDSYLTTTKNSSFLSQASYVICTNVDVEAKIFETDYAKSISINDENIFYNPLKKIQPILYSFNNAKTIQELKVCRQSISEENITNFLKSLQLIIISDDSTEDNIKGSLKGLSILDKGINIDFIYYIMLEHITNWFNSEKAYYLRKHHLETYCSMINSSVFMEKIIQQYEDVISSINIQLPSGNPQVVMIKTTRYLILMAKLYQQQQMQYKNKILLINATLEFYLITINAFQLNINLTCLICGIPSRNKENIIPNLENVLKNINDKSYKKVIILTEDVISLNCPQQVHLISDDTFYKDICLSQLYRKKYDTNSPFYIKRDFITCSKSKSLYSEKKFVSYIFKNQKKVFLISGIAGMGKSTVLSNLTNAINTEFKNLFALNINLNKYVPLFHNLIKNKRQLLLNHLTNFELKTDQFQEELLSIPNTIILMLDGLDELSKDQRALVLKFTKSNIKNSNVFKIIVSTRPEIETEIVFETFTLIPLDVNQQTKYMINSWVVDLNIDNEEQINKYKYCSHKILKKLSRAINEVGTLLGTPLMIEIIAEIFRSYVQKDCNNINEDLQDDMYKNWNILEIYKVFVERKREIYIEEKGNALGNEYRIESLSENFERLLKDCQALATTLIFGKEDIQEVFDMDPFIGTNLMCKTGLVTFSDGNFEFLHRTFAEYFFAQQLFHEIVNCNLTRIECFMFLFPWLPYTTNFLNFILESEWNKLNPKCFEICADITKSLFIEQSNLINDHILTLINNNYMNIIRLFLDDCDLLGYLEIWPEICRSAVDNKNYNILQYFIDKRMVLNITDKNGDPILHKVVEGANLEFVKYLAKMGTDFNSKNQLGQTVLYSACKKEKFQVAKFLVDIGVDVNAMDTSSNTVLYKAVGNNNLKLVKYLVKNKIDLHSANTNQQTVLYVACKKLNFTIIKYLIDNGVNINSQDECGNSVLHYAVENNSLKLVKFLVEEGADLNSQNQDKETPLHKAYQKNKLNIAKYLIKNGTDLNANDKNSNTAFHKTIQADNAELITYLAEAGADLHSKNINGDIILHLACQNNNFKLIRYLIQKGVDVNTKGQFGNSLLHLAIQCDNLSLVKYLVETGVDLNSKNAFGDSILHIACSKNQITNFLFLVDQGMDLYARDEDGNSVLHHAARGNALNLAKYLFDRGIDKCSRNKNGETALHVACKNACFDIAKYLIEQESDLNAKDNYGNSALHFSVSGGTLKLVLYLVEKGADLNSKNDKGETALHISCENSKFDIAVFLIKEGIDLSARDKCGNSVLHCAACKDDVDLVTYLVEQGVDLHSINDDKQTALHVAYENLCYNTVLNLIDKGAGIKVRDKHGDSVLHYAVRTDLLSVVIYLDGKVIFVNFKNEKKETPLHRACKNACFYIAKNLIDREMNLKALDKDRDSVLHHAIRGGTIELVTYLVDKGVNLHTVKSHKREIALHVACNNAHCNIAIYLIKKGMNIFIFTLVEVL